MDLEKLRKDHPDLVKQIEDALAKTLEEKFSKEKDKLAEKHTQELEQKEDRILSLEKKDTLRDEREMKTRADQIWSTKLAESEIAEHLFDKIQRHVGHGKFVKDGILDEEAFSTAIDAEIKDWESRGATQQVMGSGALSDSSDSEDAVSKKDQEEVDKETKSLLKLAGQEESESKT